MRCVDGAYLKTTSSKRTGGLARKLYHATDTNASFNSIDRQRNTARLYTSGWALQRKA